MKKFSFIFIFFFLLIGCNPSEKTQLKIFPIEHATTVLTFGNLTVYIDPTGDEDSFKKFTTPNYIFITDIHGDHLSTKTLSSINLSKTTIIAPKAVVDKLSEITAYKIVVINNGETKTFNDLKVEAIPMYNLREDALKYHQKGRGNGYVITIDNQRLYFSGDTEDIPEMRTLKNIDKAFVCMNLPYTMTVESAADAVLDFKPKEVYPYHYRGTAGLSDVAKFKSLVNEKDTTIKVVQLNWYPNQE